MIGPLTELPTNLPIPEDDGGAAHLLGMRLHSLALRSTSGNLIDLAGLRGQSVIFAYPMTGEPGRPLPTGWISIPGAAGCTLESCGFRDHFEEIKDLGVSVFGLSTQGTEAQEEAKNRLHLPFDLLSDESLKLAMTLKLPMMNPDGRPMIKRLTLICSEGVIDHVFYPIFPPDKHAEEVMAWLTKNKEA
jgi:peroxiredoxin